MGREQAVPRVSVIMPVHNGMPYLPQAVDSVLGQGFQDFEFIIVNDASTDGTSAYLEGLRDTRVQVIHNVHNLGVARSLNKATGEARGEYIARQDADDVSLPERLQVQVDYLESHPEVAVLGTCATFIDNAGKVLGLWEVPPADIDIEWGLLFDNHMVHTSVMVRAAVLRVSGGYPEDAEYCRAEDYELWCRIGRRHRLANLKEPLVRFRLHEGSVSARHTSPQRGQARRIALANVAWTVESSASLDRDYESARLLFLSSPSVRPELSAAALWCAVRLLLKLQSRFYAKHNFGGRVAASHRGRRRWIWGKHLLALSIRGKFGPLARLTSLLLGAHVAGNSAWAHLRSRYRQPDERGFATTRPVTIVVLGKYRKVFRGFLKSSERFARTFPKVLVRDGMEIPSPAGWTTIQGPEIFSMAGNGNLGLRAAASDSDVLYCGDDIRFLQRHTVERLSEIAHRHPEIGVLSPRLEGRGSEPQLNPSADVEYIRPPDMWFPCVYIKREVLDRIGFLDERFNGFGSDDLDFCLRAEMAGYKLAVTRLVTVQHEHARGGPTTFLKTLGRQTYGEQKAAATGKFCAKWGVDVDTMYRCLETGDYSKLALPRSEQVALVGGVRA